MTRLIAFLMNSHWYFYEWFIANPEEPVLIDRKMNNLAGLVWNESCVSFAYHRYAHDSVDVVSHMTRVIVSRLLDSLQSEDWDYPVILNWIVRFFTLLHQGLSWLLFQSILHYLNELNWWFDFSSWSGGGRPFIADRLWLANMAGGHRVWCIEFSGVSGSSFSFKAPRLATVATRWQSYLAVHRPWCWL